MEKMGLNEIREKFLSFFESKDHLRLPSFSLVPQNDNTLLLINSGMAPLKPFFTGELEPPRKRVTTCQKCIRTPDIENVGKTARHGTYFEMLGNFSFGDYFKKEACMWAWEFITEVMKIPVELLWVSIYEEDDEAKDIWVNVVGVPEERIFRMGKKDNFWEIGAGPCGPCSEIYFDRGEKYGCGSPDCKAGCECDRYIEFWNLVFTQFNSDGMGNYTPLAKPNIDTGMGLERLACMMQGVDNLFEVDTVRNIMQHISKIANVKYKEKEKTDVSLRVITDHIRSTTMMVSDGVIPSNEGRGYIVRRLLRRAARHGKLLGIDHPFLYEVCETVIAENENAYPALRENEEFIKRIIRLEEERFDRTIDAGLKILNEALDKLAEKGIKTLSGDDAFKLYDTYGFPIDLTLEIAEERGLLTDTEKFAALMQEQKIRARQARGSAADAAWSGNEEEAFKNIIATEFCGYEKNECSAKVLYLSSDGENREMVCEGEDICLISDCSCFYAEGGGQAGDIGVITAANGLEIVITDTKKNKSGVFFHLGEVIKGAVSVGDTVSLAIDTKNRDAVRRNHTATHLLQRALKNHLGDHVEQAGSSVDNSRFRFDFKHYESVDTDTLKKIEAEINEKVLQAIPVEILNLPIDEAKKLGAVALFGEKYDKIVRVVKARDYSIEFCGGTHIDNTAKIGLVKLISESSISAGVRRIEGTTGLNVLKMLEDAEEAIENAASELRCGTADVLSKTKSIIDENRKLAKQLDVLNSKIASADFDTLIKSAQSIKGLNFVSAKFTNLSIDILRNLGDRIKEKAGFFGILASVNGENINFVAVCSKEAVSAGVSAGNLVREVAKITGGGGGGRPDSASAGGKDVSKLDEALDSALKIAENMIK